MPSRFKTRAAMVLVILGASAALAPASRARDEIGTRVDSVAIKVAEMDRALAFYTGALPFEVVAQTEITGEGYAHLFSVFGMRARVVRLRLGTEEIELMDFLAPEGRPNPSDSRSNDRWFQHIAIVVSDMDRAYEHLRGYSIAHASSGPQVLPDWNSAAGGIKAFYFQDPDRNNLEIIDFPPDKGDPRWQETGRLFLGIDHTAIVVDDTERSLGFWRNTLGFRVIGESENYGAEQERLNNVFGARLRITGLKAMDGGLGVEFLEYLAPPTGRPAPLDSRANDLWHWHVAVKTRDAAAAAAIVRHHGSEWVSPGAVEGLDGALGFRAGALVRDPDGHGVLLRAP